MSPGGQSGAFTQPGPSEDVVPPSRPIPPAQPPAPAPEPSSPVAPQAPAPEAPASGASEAAAPYPAARTAAPDHPSDQPSAQPPAPAPNHEISGMASPSGPAPAGDQAPPPSFEEFWSFLRGKVATGECKLTLNGATGGFEGDTLVVTCSNGFQAERMDPAVLGRALQEMTGREFRVDVRQRPGAVTKSHGELTREAEAHPLVRQLIQEFQAHVGDVEPLRSDDRP